MGKQLAFHVAFFLYFFNNLVHLLSFAPILLLHCSAGKKLCKKNKATVSDNGTPLLRHYKEGDFHKDYDRRMTVPSMTTFLRDPAGDLPWDEDENGSDVMHIADVGVSYLTLCQIFYFD